MENKIYVFRHCNKVKINQNIDAGLLKITSNIIMERAYKINFECKLSMEVKKA